jgi:hypothetical protein
MWIPSLDDRELRERLRRRMHLVRMRASAQNPNLWPTSPTRRHDPAKSAVARKILIASWHVLSRQ